MGHQSEPKMSSTFQPIHSMPLYFTTFIFSALAILLYAETSLKLSQHQLRTILGQINEISQYIFHTLQRVNRNCLPYFIWSVLNEHTLSSPFLYMYISHELSVIQQQQINLELFELEKISQAIECFPNCLPLNITSFLHLPLEQNALEQFMVYFLSIWRLFLLALFLLFLLLLCLLPLLCLGEGRGCDVGEGVGTVGPQVTLPLQVVLDL